MSEKIFIGWILSEKKYDGTRLISEKTNRAEAGTSSYSATGNFLQYICSILVAKNSHKIRSMCLVYEFFFTDFLG